MLSNRISIHQPHYFPWIGYLDKIAKSNIFVILNEVQFEKGSQMIRNRVLDQNGAIKYINISADTKGFLDIPYYEIKVKDMNMWKNQQLNSLSNYYKNSIYRKEVLDILEQFFRNDYKTLFEWTYYSVILCMNIFDINTTIVKQSEIEYDRTSKKSDLVLSICKKLDATTYLSGNGASVTYLKREEFNKNNIDIVIQQFNHPIYKQCNTDIFIPGLSCLDMLFNCGLKESKEIFWNNIKR